MSAVADDRSLVPVYETWIDDTETPVSAFLKLRAAGDGEPCFLLESADYGKVGRFSFIGHRPRKVLRWSLGDPGDPYQLAEAELALSPAVACPELPPFAGGGVGMFAYDLVRTVEPLGDPNPDPIGVPDLALILTDTLVAFDHLKRTITVVAHPTDDVQTASRKIAEVREVLSGPLPSSQRDARTGSQPSSPNRPDAAAFTTAVPTTGVSTTGASTTGVPTTRMSTTAVPKFESNMTREQFEANVARIIEYVHAGDAFQVVPSQRWSAKVPVSAFSVYRGLRAVNPSPYMYFLDFGDFQIAGASPEPLVTVSGRKVSTRPVAGTRPRGASQEEDTRNAESLLADPKERAEHVMLVDLGRNDLGRVSEYGSVTVDDFMVVENYSHVMHIVSNVSGRLRQGVSALGALRSVLPAGTLSGAPKVRAMQIIDELEPVKRGGYGGAIGWASYTGDLDTCIHIRTVVIKDGVAHVQAGGGTVADAKPEYEYEESVAKSRAVLAAIATACEQPGWE